MSSYRSFAASMAKDAKGRALLTAVFGNSPYLTHSLIDDPEFAVTLAESPGSSH